MSLQILNYLLSFFGLVFMIIGMTGLLLLAAKIFIQRQQIKNEFNPRALVTAVKNNRDQEQISAPNKKRLRRFFSELGEKNFSKNEDAMLLWNRIQFIIEEMEYNLKPLIKSLSKQKDLSKFPEFEFIKKNQPYLERIIKRHKEIPELTLITLASNARVNSQNSIELKHKRPGLKLL